MKRNIIIVLTLVVTAAATTVIFHEFNQAGIQYSKGHRLFMDRLPEQAIPYLEEAVALRPNFTKALVELGLSSLWTGRYGEARRSFEALLRIDPKNRLAIRGLADIQAWTGQRREAIAGLLIGE